MSKLSKRALREQRGRSILENATRVLVPLESMRAVINTPNLGDKITSDLRTLYPYMKEAPGGNCSFDQLLHNFRCDTYPQGEVFFWQREVLTTLHALILSTYSGPLPERPLPPQAKHLGENATLEAYQRFPKSQRMRFHEIICMLFMEPDGCSINGPEVSRILVAAEDVLDATREENRRIERGRARRYAEVLGATCAACKSTGKGKMVCSRCLQVFYCGRECQIAHWKEHKKECVKKESVGPTETT